MVDTDEIEKSCPFKKEKWWDDLAYCQEFGLCECRPKYDEVVNKLEKERVNKDENI